MFDSYQRQDTRVRTSEVNTKRRPLEEDLRFDYTAATKKAFGAGHPGAVTDWRSETAALMGSGIAVEPTIPIDAFLTERNRKYLTTLFTTRSYDIHFVS
jgi:hypothetical protein